MMVGDGLDDEGDQAGERRSGDDGANGPQEDLAADDEATQIHVLLLLLALVPGPSEEPALLSLVQLPGSHRQRRAVQIEVAAAVIIGGGVGVDLQRPAPGIAAVDAHPFPVSFLLALPRLKMRPSSLSSTPFSLLAKATTTIRE
ncbi:hypothetical protein MUK42_29279 [Musa troglodytarum]|uniref:Uncharacterized protein n=1 Tax=Musa troglodytarum TaxID=320322 RepID=A0A9E7FX10_9LILI|nr:hypothetical protein MUK42_29279 [Musa troglodytarum]